jgi:ERCC4-related helicase
MSTIKTEEEYNNLVALYKRGSMQSLALINNDLELEDFQTFVLAFCYIRKKVLISLDTGLGKTLIASALINLDPSQNNWLFICKNSNLEQTFKKLTMFVRNKTIIKSTGSEADMNRVIRKAGTNKVICLTYNCFESLEIQNYIFNNRAYFEGIIVDESHSIGNIGSNRAEVLKHMLRNCFKYQFLLTATPLSTNPTQILNQMNILDDEYVPDPEELAFKHTIWNENKEVIGYKNMNELYERIEERYISFTRQELEMRGNYKPQLKLVDPPYDIPLEELRNVKLLKQIKSTAGNSAVEEVKRIVLQQRELGRQGLIYANLNVYKDLIMNTLSGIRIKRLDGSCNNETKRQIQEEFNSGGLDVLVCNLLEGVDLPCDYIIFYEMTVLSKQFIGRGERGLEGRDLDIFFVVMRNTHDVDFFYKNIYKRAIILEQLCKKDVAEIKEISHQLENNLTGESLEEFEILQKFQEYREDD